MTSSRSRFNWFRSESLLRGSFTIGGTISTMARVPESLPEADPASTASVPNDSRLALCLSGGGFRAALFHLGALRRLNELGILSKVDTIASVSGGSIVAVHLATHVRPWPTLGTAFDRWHENVETPFLHFAQKDIRTWPLVTQVFFPWNWLRPSAAVAALEAYYQKRLTGLKLLDLPERPAFVFCATDMIYGVSWVFERRRVGSYRA